MLWASLSRTNEAAVKRVFPGQRPGLWSRVPAPFLSLSVCVAAEFRLTVRVTTALDALAVHPAHQRQGIGRMLLDWGVEQAHGSGRHVYLVSMPAAWRCIAALASTRSARWFCLASSACRCTCRVLCDWALRSEALTVSSLLLTVTGEVDSLAVCVRYTYLLCRSDLSLSSP